MAILDYLESVIDSPIKATGNGSQWKMNCPFCGESRMRFFVSTKTHQVYCHNCESHGARGSFINFIMAIEGISYDKAFQRYKDIKGSAFIPDEVLKELKENIFKPEIKDIIGKRAIPLPVEYAPLDLKSNNLVNKRAISYLLSRKITYKQMQEHKMGFCVGGEYSNRVIIPILENDELKFWVARAIGTHEYLKEKSPSNESYQISKSQVIFNIYTASRIYGCAVISEGIFDSLSFGDIGISLLGKSLYEDQLAILLEYKDYLPGGVYIALDYDARQQAIKMADELSKYMPVHLVNIPQKYDDPNNFLQKLGRRELLTLVDEAEEYGTMSKLRQKFFIK